MAKKKIISTLALLLTSSMVLNGCSLAGKVPGYGFISDLEKIEGALSDSNANQDGILINALMTGEDVISFAEESGTYSESELNMLKLEYKLDNSGLSEEEYRLLASLYEELGFIKCERDLLEQDYRLFGDQEVLEKLKTISVNLLEEENAIISAADQVLFDFSVPERIPEIVHSIEGNEWFSEMMPKLKEGKRTYFREKNGIVDFSIEVGYNDFGEYESSIRYLPHDSVDDITGIIISRTGDTIKVYEETSTMCNSVDEIGGELGEAKFTLWTIDTYAGTIKTEEGTMKNGKMEGAYKVTISQPVGAAEVKHSAFDIFNNKETLPSEEYNGQFDENGKSLLEEPSESNIEALAKSIDAETVSVYAYNADKSKCLFKGITKEEKEQGVIFGSNDLALPKRPEIEYYDMRDKSSYSLDGIVKIAMHKENSSSGYDASGGYTGDKNGGVGAEDKEQEKNVAYIPEDSLKVRIYDGKIQIYNGTTWISMGDAKEIAKEDPFGNDLSSWTNSESAQTSEGTSDTESDKVNGTQNSSDEKVQVATNKPTSGVGSLKPATNNTSGTQKPSTSINSSSQKPSASQNSGNQKPATSQTANKPATPTTGGQSSAQQNNSTPSTPQVSTPDPTPSAPAPSTPDPTPSTPAPSTPDPTPSTPDPAPSTPEPSTPDPGPGDSAPSGGDDSDVEYSPDMD